MIITKTPFRMSFFGGGTDIEDYFKTYGGAVLSTTFDKYCYVNVRKLPPFFDYSTEVVYQKIERVSKIKEIEHPAIRNAMDYLDVKDLRLTYEADLPARSGLGTSSSFAVGMLSAFYALKGIYVDDRKLAEEAIYLERVLCNEAGGWQDQIAAAFGGLNKIIFSEDEFKVYPVVVSKERKKNLENNLMLFFTGFTRLSSTIQLQSKSERQTNISYLHEMKQLVYDAENILTNESVSLDEFGKMLDYEWKLKKQTSKYVSTEVLDHYYDIAIKAGALGGKLLGAGGGGFFLFYVPQEAQQNVKHKLEELLYMPFEFENEGTRVIYYASEDNKMKM